MYAPRIDLQLRTFGKVMDPVSTVGSVQVGLQAVKQAANQEANVATLLDQAQEPANQSGTTIEASGSPEPAGQSSPPPERGQIVDIFA